LQSGASKDVDGEVKEHKRKRDAKPIDRDRAQKVKDVAKGLGMTCKNKPLWSAEARKQALIDAPKDRDGGIACSCIKHQAWQRCIWWR
jgi:hypothetical protein